MTTETPSKESGKYSISDLEYLMNRLRDAESGCPWDIAQTPSSLVSYTLEECYELIDAIENENWQQTKEELGDVLFQVVFYAKLASEQEQFSLGDIISSLTEKLLRRHPHVFPQGTLSSRVEQQLTDPQEIRRKWDDIKAGERGKKNLNGVLDDIPSALPALIRAEKLQKRVSTVGFDWSDIKDVFKQLQSEMKELEEAQQHKSIGDVEEELGDVLFSCVNLARHLKLDPEQALRKANRKFEHRFGYIEQQLTKTGKTPAKSTLALMDELWEQAKENGL